MRPNLDIYDYIEKLEQREFDDDIRSFITKAEVDYDMCKWDREDCGFDERCKIGIRIMNSDLAYGVKGNRTKERQFINIIDDKLRHKCSELQSADVIYALKSKDGEIEFAQELLESEIVYATEFTNLPKAGNTCVLFYLYIGLGVIRVEWDANAPSGSNWKTGVPVPRSVDVRKIYINKNCEEIPEDIKDIFYKEEYFTEDLKKEYPEHADEITHFEEKTNAEVTDRTYNDTSRKTTPVIIHTYYKKYPIKQRYLSNEDTGDGSAWTEKEFVEYLEQRVGEIIEQNRIEEFLSQAERFDPEKVQEYTEKNNPSILVELADTLSQQTDNNIIFDEKILASGKLTREYRVWFEHKFIPRMQISLEKPKLFPVCVYSFLAADRDMDSAYPISMAYKNASLMELYNTILTLQVYYAIKFHKPQVVVEPGALTNEKEFLKHLGDPAFPARVDGKWRLLNPKRDPYKFMYPQEMGRVAELLEKKLQLAIETYTRATKAVLGQSEFAGEAAASVIAKQQTAKQGDKSDNIKLQEFYKQIGEIYKYMVAFYKRFPHKIEHLNDQDEKDMIWVNTNDENNLLNRVDDTYIEVTVEDNIDQISEKKKYDAMLLLSRNLLSPVDALKMYDPDDVEEKIKNLKAQNDAVQLMELLNGLPEELRRQILQQISGMVQQQNQQGNLQENTPKEKQQGSLEKEPKGVSNER